MSSNDELNIAVGEALGVDLSKCNRRLYFCCECFKEVDANHGFDHQVMVYSKPCPNYAGDMRAAIGLLDGRCWVLHTCDAGYLCQIHEAPEKGEAVLGNGVGATPAEAICRAFLEMKKWKKLEWFFGPTETDPDSSKMWCNFCGGLVGWFKDGSGGGGYVCSKCKAHSDD